eukprot:gene524-700_t
MNASSIQILTGNIFECSYDRGRKDSQLPAADPESRSYNCGSNSADLALYIWCGLAVVMIVLFALCSE